MGWAEISELLHLSTLPEERQLGRGERSQTLLRQLTPSSDLREPPQTCHLEAQPTGGAAPDAAEAKINQRKTRARGGGRQLLPASPLSPQERAARSSRSIRGIRSCTCIRPGQTEGLSAASPLRFLPLVFLIPLLNSRFQEEHRAWILCFLRRIRHPVNYPGGRPSSSLPAAQGHGHTHILLPPGTPNGPSAPIFAPGAEQTPLQAALPSAGCPQKAPTQNKRQATPAAEVTPTPAFCTQRTPPERVPPAQPHVNPQIHPNPRMQWVRCRRRNRRGSCRASRGRRDVSSGLIGY